MSKKELIERWASPAGLILRKNILDTLTRKKSLSKVDNLAKFEGRWDLRGISFPSPKSIEKISVDNFSFDRATGVFKIKDVQLKNIDFSYSNISYSEWISCVIENCLFNYTKAEDLTFTACHFSNLSFMKTNFSNSFMNLNIGADSGSYTHVNFIETNLSKTSFGFPLIHKCKFVDCKLFEVNFDGSRLEGCSFKGVFKSGWIGGYSIYARKSFLGIFNRVNPKDYRNKMENVDFTECFLDDVFFQYEVDLKGCTFSENSNFVLVRDMNKTYSAVRSIIENDWEGEDKRVGLYLIDIVYWGKLKVGMTKDYINTAYVEFLDKIMQEKFYNLIRANL